MQVQKRWKSADFLSQPMLMQYDTIHTQDYDISDSKKLDIESQSPQLSTRQTSESDSSSYFKADSKQYDEIYEFENIAGHEMKDVSASYASWSWNQFIEFFSYHFVFYIMGPFSCIFFWVVHRNLHVYRNLGFKIGGDFYFFQLIMWLFTLTITVLYYTQETVQENIEFFEVYNVWIILLFRMFSVACRYAMMHPIAVYLYKQTIISKREKSRDFYLGDWLKQNEDCQCEQLICALKRDEIELSLLTPSFSEKLSQQMQLDLQALKEKITIFIRKHKHMLHLKIPYCDDVLSAKCNNDGDLHIKIADSCKIKLKDQMIIECDETKAKQSELRANVCQDPERNSRRNMGDINKDDTAKKTDHFFNKSEGHNDIISNSSSSNSSSQILTRNKINSKNQQIDRFSCNDANQRQGEQQRPQTLDNNQHKQNQTCLAVGDERDNTNNLKFQVKQIQDQLESELSNPIPSAPLYKDNEFCGMTILSYLINTFNVKCRFYTQNRWPVIISSVRSIMCLLYRLIFNPSAFDHFDWSVSITTAFGIGVNFILYYIMCRFLIAVLADLHRIYYLMIQMLFFIRPRKDDQFLCHKKVFPTLNLVDSNNFKIWIQLRRISCEYGKKFWLRGQVNLSFMVLYSLYPIACLFVYLFDLFEFSTLEVWFRIYDFIIISVSIAVSLYFAASINYSYAYHATILEEIRILFRNLKSKEAFLATTQLSSYLYRAIVAALKEATNNDYKIINQKIKNILNSIDDTKSELLLLEATQPFQCLGISITFVKLKSILLFLFSLLTFSINFYLKTH